MWDQVIEMAASSGIWALLFVTLFFIELRDSKTREEKYQATVESLAEKLSVVLDIKEDVQEIKTKM